MRSFLLRITLVLVMAFAVANSFDVIAGDCSQRYIGPAPVEQIALPGQPGYIDFNRTNLEVGDSVYVVDVFSYDELRSLFDCNGFVFPHCLRGDTAKSYRISGGNVFCSPFAQRTLFPILMAIPEQSVVVYSQIPPIISLETAPFKRDVFFGSGGPVKMVFFGDFARVLREVPETVPVWNGSLKKTETLRVHPDSEVMNKLGHPQPFTVSEFAAIAKDLISQQPNGEVGVLLLHGSGNIFYVKMKEGVIVVAIFWNYVQREWHLDAFGLDDGWWNGSLCVFSRARN